LPSGIASENLSAFVSCDLNEAISPTQVGREFDLVILADVLEHLVHPERLLKSVHAVLGENGSVIVSLPNFGHWYPRLKILAGQWKYDEKGILDKTHLRFFSLRTGFALCAMCGFEPQSKYFSTTPWELILRNGVLLNQVTQMDQLLVRLRPDLFAYQMIFCLKSVSARG
jgi:SAM-dependent methyltransferase